MANPLQPKIIKCLEKEYKAFVVNIVSTSKSGTMDLIACIPTSRYFKTRSNTIKVDAGLFYGFEIKWGKDRPSELQKQKINACIDAGGRAYFIYSVEQLRQVLKGTIPMEYYEVKKKFTI